MNQEQSKKYEKIAKITGVIIGLVLVLGISYAVFKTTTLSDKTNEISAGKLDLRIDHEKDEILLENAVPITEEEGLKQSPYVFDVVNEGTINAAYDLYIEVDEEISTLSSNVVRYYLTVEEDNEEKIVTSSSRIIDQEEVVEKEGKKLYKIDRKYIDTNKTNKYKLYLWIDYEATTEEAANKYFEARVVIEGEQIYDKNRLVKQIDVSELGDNSVIAYMYADGRVVIKGKGNIASNLSNTLIYENEEGVNDYKKFFTFMGYDVSNLNTIEEIINYMTPIMETDPDFDSKMTETMTVFIGKEVLEEMGEDSTSITDENSLMAYLTEKGWIDADGNQTESGTEFFEKFEAKSNTFGSTDPIAPSKIELEEGITNIPEGLFTGNEEIKEVRIPKSVVTIDNYAFQFCSSLTRVEIPNSVTNIGRSAFSECISLTGVEIPDGVTSIGNEVFSNCSSLTSIEISSNVTSIGEGAFFGCTSLTELVIPSTVKSIGEYSFKNCHGIKKLTIDGTKDYPDLCIANVEELIITGTGNMVDSYSGIKPWYSSVNTIKKVIIKNGITNIGSRSFQKCINLINVEIPDNVTSIGHYAFWNCTALINIDLPKSLITIGNNVFNGCTSLNSIEIPNSVTSIGGSAFAQWTSSQTINIDNTEIFVNSNWDSSWKQSSSAQINYLRS